MLKAGSTLSNATVAQKVGEDIKTFQIRELFDDGPNVLIGLPGAFTPVCTQQHIPGVIKLADKIKASGIKNIYCISTDNPWTLEAWQNSMEGADKIEFLSDGNKEFLQSSNLKNNRPELFIADTMKRFYCVVEGNIVKQLQEEDDVMKIDCTNGMHIYEAVDKAFRETS